MLQLLIKSITLEVLTTPKEEGASSVAPGNKWEGREHHSTMLEWLRREFFCSLKAPKWYYHTETHEGALTSQHYTHSFFILTKVVCFLIYWNALLKNPGEFPLPPLVSLATLGWEKRIWHQVNLSLTKSSRVYCTQPQFYGEAPVSFPI